MIISVCKRVTKPGHPERKSESKPDDHTEEIMKKNRIVYLVAALLIASSVFTGFSIKASGNRPELSNTNVEAEREYVSSLKTVLKDNHYPTAGITLTKTSDDGFYIEYTVDVHTGCEYSEELREALEAVDLNVKESEVYINLS